MTAPDPKTVVHTPVEPPKHEKQIEVTLLYIALTGLYQVHEIKNAACYRPGYLLAQNVVEHICAHDNWTVDIQDYDLFSKILNVVKPNIKLL